MKSLGKLLAAIFSIDAVRQSVRMMVRLILATVAADKVGRRPAYCRCVTVTLVVMLSASVKSGALAEEATQGTEPPVQAEDTEALAKKLANPIAALISVPLQMNYNTSIGPLDDGDQFYTNIQPVIPISLSEDWNLISRTILPVIYQDDIFPGAGDQFGLGDTTQSLFFSPKAPSSFGGLIWGVGPVFLIPTGTDELLGAEKLGVGPTAVVLKQSGPWTIGALANHIWSVAGNDDRADVNSTFLQPFVSYTTKDAWTFSLNTESSYNWESEEWSVPVNFNVTKILKLGDQLMSIGPGIRYWAESPDNGPEDFGARLTFTFLFPKGQ